MNGNQIRFQTQKRNASFSLFQMKGETIAFKEDFCLR